MKTKISLLILLFLPVLLFSQNIKIRGTIYGSELNENPSIKIYYTSNGKKVNLKNFIKVSDNNAYELTLSQKQIKSEDIKQLFFTLDTALISTREDACLHKIEIEKIIELKSDENPKEIIVYCDLLLDYFCPYSTLYHGAEQDGLDRFVGNYQLQKGSEQFNVSLNDFAFNITATKSIDAEMFNGYTGRWNFNTNTNMLIIYFWRKVNQDLGLMKVDESQYEFEVIEEGGKLIFKSPEYRLNKIN